MEKKTNKPGHDYYRVWSNSLLDPIMPDIVIETISFKVAFETFMDQKPTKENQEKQYQLGLRIEKYLTVFLKGVYNANEKFRKDIKKKNGIETLRMFLLHWIGFDNNLKPINLSHDIDRHITKWYAQQGIDETTGEKIAKSTK